METIRSRKKCSFKKSQISQAIPKPSLYNAHGVVENPDFVMVRPTGTKGEITLTVRAHCIGKGQWVAAATWGSLSGHLPFDGRYPSKWSQVFKSRSEVVEYALNVALRQIKQQLGKLAKTPVWNGKIEAAAAWCVFQPIVDGISG